MMPQQHPEDPCVLSIGKSLLTRTRRGADSIPRDECPYPMLRRMVRVLGAELNSPDATPPAGGQVGAHGAPGRGGSPSVRACVCEYVTVGCATCDINQRAANGSSRSQMSPAECRRVLGFLGGGFSLFALEVCRESQRIDRRKEFRSASCASLAAIAEHTTPRPMRCLRPSRSRSSRAASICVSRPAPTGNRLLIPPAAKGRTAQDALSPAAHASDVKGHRAITASCVRP